METARQTVEDALFTNAYTPTNTQYSKHWDFDSDNDNQGVVKLNASSCVNKKTGPTLVLKVMKGDQVELSTYPFYNTSVQSPPRNSNLLDGLLSALSGGVVTASSDHQTSEVGVESAVSLGVLQFFSEGPDDDTRPKAYLNWILFDEQMQYVSSALMIRSFHALLGIIGSYWRAYAVLINGSYIYKK